MPFTPFHHIALQVDKETQDGIEQRLKEAGFKEPQIVRARARLLPLASTRPIRTA